MMSTFQFDSRKRPTASVLLKHPFFKNHAISKDIYQYANGKRKKLMDAKLKGTDTESLKITPHGITIENDDVDNSPFNLDKYREATGLRSGFELRKSVGKKPTMVANRQSYNAISPQNELIRKSMHDKGLMKGSILLQNSEVKEPIYHKTEKLIQEMNEYKTRIKEPTPRVNDYKTRIKEPTPRVNDYKTRIKEPTPRVNDYKTRLKEPTPEMIEFKARIKEPSFPYYRSNNDVMKSLKIPSLQQDDHNVYKPRLKEIASNEHFGRYEAKFNLAQPALVTSGGNNLVKKNRKHELNFINKNRDNENEVYRPSDLYTKRNLNYQQSMPELSNKKYNELDGYVYFLIILDPP
jgi:hypothetical protein